MLLLQSRYGVYMYVCIYKCMCVFKIKKVSTLAAIAFLPEGVGQRVDEFHPVVTYPVVFQYLLPNQSRPFKQILYRDKKVQSISIARCIHTYIHTYINVSILTVFIRSVTKIEGRVLVIC